MNIDESNLKKISANQIQQHLKGILNHDIQKSVDVIYDDRIKDTATSSPQQMKKIPFIKKKKKQSHTRC